MMEDEDDDEPPAESPEEDFSVADFSFEAFSFEVFSAAARLALTVTGAVVGVVEAFALEVHAPGRGARAPPARPSPGRR